MELRTPGGDWFSALTDVGAVLDHASGHSVLDEPTVEQLASALDAMRAGDIEFVILEDGDEFAQAAGDGDGPYALEHHAGDGTIVEVADASFDLVALVLTKYGARDASWRDDLSLPPAPAAADQPAAPPAPGGGLFARLRGRKTR